MSERYIGLISGTSMDAVDAALVTFDASDKPAILATHAQAPDSRLRSELLALSQDVAGVTLPKLGELDQRVGHWFADAALTLMRDNGIEPDTIRAIGSHGQTLYHAPRAHHPFSLQIGDPNQIAARTGIDTVAHLRGSDIAVGGQGAPLVPALHHKVLQHASEHRCIVNIGGIANITLLPACADAQDASGVLGFDTGPGNAMMDAWIAEHLGNAQDTNGEWAANGQIDEALLSLMLQEPYFHRQPPKSTGREHFNLGWIQRHLSSVGRPPNPPDVQRTLCELTARSIAAAIEDYGPDTERVLLCGGGARNRFLRQRISDLTGDRVLEDTDAHGIAIDWVEAATMAWLAMRTVHGLPGNLPKVTGASRPVVLGGIYTGKR